MKIIIPIILSLFLLNIVSAQTKHSEDSGTNHPTVINDSMKSAIGNTTTYDVMFEGYESQRIYDKEYILRPIPQIRNYKGISLPPSVYLKIWETHTDTITKTITPTGYVQLYWIGPKERYANNKKIWNQMINLCGVRQLSFITNEDSTICLYAVPANWMYHDTLFAASHVKQYGNTLVTKPGYSCFIIPDKGKMKEYSGTSFIKEKSQLSHDLNRIVHLTNETFMLLPRKHDIPTEEEQELNLFARDINRNMPQNAPKNIDRKYEITLFIDSLGRPYLHNFHPLIKDSVDNIVLSNLDYSIKLNQYDTFRRLITVDGMIFPWKFINATYYKGLWYLKDKIWTVEEKKKYYLEQKRETIHPQIPLAQQGVTTSL